MPTSPSIPLTPSFPIGTHTTESPSNSSLISALNLTQHIEGGYFAEIDRAPLLIPNPFPSTTSNTSTSESLPPLSGSSGQRNISTAIFYLLTPVSPQGHFHRNAGRTVHTLIQGRGVYVLIHADEEGREKRVESFVVGKDVEQGERMCWIVEGGKYKASFLLPSGEDEERLLISEVC
jgi:predicted cupin superfamily sugar epimerase